MVGAIRRDSSIGAVLWVSVLLTTISLASGHIKLNVPRVRLPYFDHQSVNFTLRVETPGCYTWSVTRPDFITITTMGDVNSFDYDGTECASQVTISAAPRISPCCPASAIVYVEDRVTKEMVRCDVIIDKIVSLSIHTTTKELHMEEAPSEFHVQGHGSKGDTFSTLDGVPFRWWLESVGPEAVAVEPQSIMRFMTFAESTYQAPPGVASLESKRLQGSTILVEGLKTGSARVFAKLTDSIYKNVAPAEVRIVVVANLQVDPREAYVIPDTRLPLKLRQMRHGKLVDISLPSKIYNFEVVNDSVVSYDPQTSVITAHDYGTTDIIVRDMNALATNLGEEDLMEHSEGLISRINVREPKFLALTVLPHRNWALRIGQEYEIQVDIYDGENQKIFITDNILVETIFDSEYFKVIKSSKNGTYHVGVPVKIGSAKVQARLKHTIKLDGSTVEPPSAIRVKADMEIFQSVVIQPAEIILPWDPNLHPKHDIRFTASGGNGNFFWTSTNTSVVTVTQAGLARTENMGFANITASMTINSNIKGSARVYVLPPTEMRILEHNVAAEIGSSILVPLSFYTVRPNDPTKTLVPFSRCHQVPFQVHIEDPSIFTYDDKTYYQPAKPSCAYLPVVGASLGSSLVTITYKVQDLVFTDSVVVSTFKPLTIVEPQNALTVLAVGSSRQIVFQGGPRPLVENHGFFRAITVENEAIAAATELKSKDQKEDVYVYTVVCKEIGETEVVFELGNRPKQQQESSRAVLRAAKVTVVCAEPAKIYFKVESPIKSGGVKCPSEASATQVVRVAIPNYENSRISVVVKDANGRKFDNVTSLQIEWSATPDLLSLSHPKQLTTDSIPMLGYETPGSTYQTVIPDGRSGNVVLTAEIIGYDQGILSKAGVSRTTVLSSIEEDYNDRSFSMDLQLVSDVSAFPSEISLFNHPSSKLWVKIEEGSGFFDYEIVGDQAINVMYFESNKSLQVTPLTEGSSKILIRDLCLTSRKVAYVTAQVNGIGVIDVGVHDKIELGQETNLTVTVYDKGGNLLPAQILSKINLRLSPIDKGILQLTPLEPTGEDNAASKRRFIAKGHGVGVVLVTFNAEGPGKLVQSVPVRIAVFSPLRVRPRNITLLVGSVYQVRAMGGPEEDANTIYKTRLSHDVASVTSGGIIQGRKVGKTSVGVFAVNRNAEDSVYSEDDVLVRVVSLRGIRVISPLTRIQTGYEMPLHIVGIGDNGEQLLPPVLVGDRKPLLSIEWMSSNGDVASLNHVFQSRGYTPDSGDQLSMRFVAKAPGSVVIKVFALYNGEHQHMDEIKIEVYDRVYLVNRPCGFDNLLMTPNSEMKLQTNRDDASKVQFKLLRSSVSDCDDTFGVCSTASNVVSLSSDGVVTSHGITGQAVVEIMVTEEFGHQHSSTAVIDVKTVSYMMLTPELQLAYEGKHAGVLPRGVLFPLRLSFHDSVGKRFDAVRIRSKSRSNRHDLLQVKASADNYTFLASATHEGRTCVHILDAQVPTVADYLVMNVAEAIEPKLPLGIVTVGDIICFASPIKSEGKKTGIWTSTVTNVATVDGLTGMTHAHSPGFTRMEYTLPLLGSVSGVDLNVVPVDKLKFDVPSSSYVEITNGDPNHVYDVFVQVSDKKSSLIGTNCSEEFVREVVPPFTCSLVFENVDVVGAYFAVNPVFNYEKRQYACRIKVLQTTADAVNLNYVHSNLVLSASSHQEQNIASNHRREVKSDPLMVMFNPALTLHSKDLTLYGNDPYYEAQLKLTGLGRLLDNIQIIPSDSTYVKVENQYAVSTLASFLPHLGATSPPVSPQANTPETRTYAIFLHHDFASKAELDENFRLHVTIISPATKQQLTIPIKVKFRPHLTAITYNTKTWSGWLWNLYAQTTSYILAPLFYVLVTVLLAHFTQRFIVAMREKKRPGTTSVFVSNQGDQNASTPRRFLPSGSSCSPKSPYTSFAGGDHTHSPASSASSPLRPKLFSTVYDQDFQGSPFAYSRRSPSS